MFNKILDVLREVRCAWDGHKVIEPYTGLCGRCVKVRQDYLPAAANHALNTAQAKLGGTVLVDGDEIPHTAELN